MIKVALVDYGVGNLFSISRALEREGLSVDLISSVEGLRGKDAAVLPGVGNFKVASNNIRPFKEAIVSLLDEGIPLLGVCLGMQLLFEVSEESGSEGLKLIEGKVVELPRHVKKPHVGWNTLRIIRRNELLEGIGEGEYFYFVHSYYPKPADEGAIVAATDYGLEFPSVIALENIYATQFHPEKSGRNGALLLRNFAEIVKR